MASLLTRCIHHGRDQPLRLLPCQQAVCETCLDSEIKYKSHGQGRKFFCPCCFSTHDVILGGVEAYPVIPIPASTGTKNTLTGCGLYGTRDQRPVSAPQWSSINGQHHQASSYTVYDQGHYDYQVADTKYKWEMGTSEIKMVIHLLNHMP